MILVIGFSISRTLLFHLRLALCLVIRSVLFCGRYVFGITHVPRLEDWPVMPVDRIGFTLMVRTLTRTINLMA